MKTNRMPFLLGALICWGVFAGPARASTILLVTSTIADLSSPWSQTLSIQRFNTTLGVLTSVEIQATLNVTASIDFLNKLWSNGCTGASYPTAGCPSPQPVAAGGGQAVLAASASIPFTVTGPTGTVSGTASVALPGVVIVPPKTGYWLCSSPFLHVSAVNEGGCVSVTTDGELSVSGLTTTETTPLTSVGLAGWSGSGAALVNFNATTENTDCFRNAHTGVYVGCQAVAGGSFSVLYTYDPTTTVPEPVTAMMIGGGFIGLALMRRRGRSA
jgi:hypothetical protein